MRDHATTPTTNATPTATTTSAATSSDGTDHGGPLIDLSGSAAVAATTHPYSAAEHILDLAA